ncbi:hypothetical protein RUM44_001077 [Polyplax serrata]|uniref:Centrosomal protein CCDC61 n=1 Tax=Polyplax serrata TaxID=468196 RepID=A0ABR1B6M0_POLSC
MCVLNSKKLELIVTDKLMAEDWQCEYDASYIEALTHKTGNFKQFDVFIVMLKSGLLKTSESIALDLLTVEDLEDLRNKKAINSYPSSRAGQNPNLNKRYLILTYSVEFDRIHYPLPLDYCGPPNPSILQSNIRRLEAEVERLKQKNISLNKSEDGETKKLKEKLNALSDDNAFLTGEVRRLNKLLTKKGNPVKNIQLLQLSVKKLEDRVTYERNRSHQSIAKLKTENIQLTHQVDELKKREKCLKLKLREVSRQICHRGCRRTAPSHYNRDNSAGGRCVAVRHQDSLLFHPVPISNSPTKPQKTRRAHNKFLSSSSSESDSVKATKVESRNILPVTISRKTRSSEKSRNVSEGRSRASSEDSKRRPQTQKSSRNSVKDTTSREAKGENCGVSYDERRGGVRSRDSSLSSRSSSNKSRVSRMSNRGSGDHQTKKRSQTPTAVESSKEG